MTAYGLNSSYLLFLEMKFYWDTAMPIHLWLFSWSNGRVEYL